MELAHAEGEDPLSFDDFFIYSRWEEYTEIMLKVFRSRIFIVFLQP